MKSRRHTSVLLLLIMASVFLCSCGIPSYIVPTVSITSTSNTDTQINFTVHYESESSLPGSVDRIGMLLLYVADDSPANDKSDTVIRDFSKNYKINDYDGTAVRIVSGEPIYTSVVNSADVDVYPFLNKNGETVGAPFYNLSLDNSAPVTMNLSLKLLPDDSVTVFDNILGSDIKVLSEPSGDYIRVYAAICVQSRNYSNLYWSDLKYLGVFRK